MNRSELIHIRARHRSSLSPWAIAYGVARLLLIGTFVVATNFGFGQRVSLLIDQGRFGTLLPFLAIWGLSIAAIAVAAMQSRLWVRFGWGLLIAASTAVAWGYHRASQSELSVFDMISLWNARHEASRAADFYQMQIVLAGAVLIVGFLLIVAPPPAFGPSVRRTMARLALLPLVPILLVDGIVYAKSGGGSQSLPSQFTPVALGSLAAAKISLQGVRVRKDVAWQPLANQPKQNLVFLVDESIRADYLDFAPGNPYTPHLAPLAAKLVNFGPAVSGGNCSNYSNAILRFAASREDLVDSVNTSPTLFQYAKKAGYRTVYIDAQAGNITNPGLLQNYMTVQEKTAIDGFYAIRDLPAEQADGRLSEIVRDELARAKSGPPVFIYANKNGAHFPYDHSYPADQTLFHPAMRESASDTQQARIASYHNAIAWSVDRFMAGLFASADLGNASLVYTSDHAQTLDPRLLTHCQVDDPDPRMGLVPLLAYSSDAATQAAFAKGASLSRGKANHFQIAPTLLQLMGYAPADIASAYDESLFAGSVRPAQFTSGDIFGLFGSAAHWNAVDLGKDYREPAMQVSANAGAGQ